MTRDGAHGLDLSYNRLNLIEKVVRSGATLANYSYLSDGTKVSATNGAGDGFFYAGSLVYRKAGDRLTLESAGFDGGRFVVTNTGVEARYFESDHLGSTRVVVNAGGEVLERNDYYPYGMRWSDPSSLLSDNRYGYNGKERQDFVDLPYLDYGARQYDPEYRMSWNGQDQLAENYRPVSPYVFCADDPISNMDMDGRKIVQVNQVKGKTSHQILYQNGEWTAAAKGSDAMILGEAMMKTSIGKKVWNDMAVSSTLITMQIDNSLERTSIGRVILGEAYTKCENGVRMVHIIVYKGSLLEYTKLNKTFQDREKQEMYRNSTEEEQLGAVSTHEGTHSVDESLDRDREQRAITNEKEYLREIERSKPILQEKSRTNLFNFKSN